MSNRISKKTVLTCCLMLVIQSSGLAGLLLGCGCLSPWGECCCMSPAMAEEHACCCAPAAVAVPDCCKAQDEPQQVGEGSESSQSGCPCWQADTDQVVTLPSSRSNLQPDSASLAGPAALVSLSSAVAGERSSARGRGPVAPRFRLQSLLCVWII